MRGVIRALFAAMAIAAVLAPLSGCSRSKARLRADRDAYYLLDQKSTVAGGELGQYRIGVDPASRMHDENNPDCPPMPPDDPTSHRYLECVDGKKGAKCWREAPRTPWVESPNWREFLPVDEQGRLVLDTAAAVRLGLINDPDFQQELEELYLSSLDVSFERFRFDTQLLGGSAVDFVAQGRDRTGTGESSSQLFVSPSSRTLGPAAPNRWRFQRLTATGGEIVAGLANTLVWQFSGPNNYSSATLLDFSIVQPLLRGGGRVRVLERLTVAERTLLANVRAMERFRREYYLNVVVGRFTSGGPQRRGGLLGGAGLANFAGVNLQLGGGGGGGFFGGGGQGVAGAQAAGGYLGLLQTQQVLTNQRANVASLRDSVLQLEASYEAGRLDRFQVDLARQALFNAQSQLLRAEADFETTLDNFKIELGMPPDLELVIADPLLDRFKLLSPEVTELQNGIAAVVLAKDDPGVPAVEGPELVEPQEVIAAEPVAAGPSNEAIRLLDEAAAQLAIVEQDVQKLLAAAPARRRHLEEIRTRPEIAETQIDPLILDPERLDTRIESIENDLGRWQDEFAEVRTELTDADEQDEPKALRRLSALVLELSILQARARLDALDIEPTQLTAGEALEIARVNRRDWANARAALVDAWRLIHFNANDLQSAVDLVFSGDLGNVGDDPFDLRTSNSRLRVGVEFDSPTSRLAERNVYRQSLIEYQQARRSYYQFVDRIHQSLRSTLRQIRLNEINFELRREAVLVAIAQVDLTQLRLSEPPKPGEEEQFGDTTARDLVQALGDLLNAQNDLLSVWVNNRVQRFNLELDLGIMLVDSEGLRVDFDGPLEDFLPQGPCPGGGDVTPVDCLPRLNTANPDHAWSGELAASGGRLAPSEP